MDKMTPEYQRAVSDMVRREVYYCVSSLVSTLASGWGVRIEQSVGFGRDTERFRDLENLCEQAGELASPIDDYEEAARQAGWEEDTVKGVFFLDQGDDCPVVANADPGDACGWEELCREADIEPYQNDVYEHWLVSGWLASQLCERGEKVDDDFAGMTVWARTCTGQSIGLDRVICEIYDAGRAEAA